MTATALAAVVVAGFVCAPSAWALDVLEARGHWDAFGTPAAVDWCEPNYAVVPWIAEFWNTLSSVLIAAAGVFGLVRWWGCREGYEVRFAVCFAGLAIVGVGSTLFHGTLLKLPQATDELPMIWLGLVCFYCLMTRHADTPRSTRRRWAWGLASYALVFTVAYFSVSNYFGLFLASYIAVAGYVCIGTWRIVFREATDPRLRTLFWWSVGAFVGGFVLLWLPERGLGCDHPFQRMQPHAWFHLITGATGPYMWTLVAVLDRFARLGTPGQLDLAPIPFARPR